MVAVMCERLCIFEIASRCFMQYSNINPVFSKGLPHPADVVEAASLAVSHLDPCLCPLFAFARCRMCPSHPRTTTFGSLFQKNCCCLVIHVCVCVYVCVSASVSVCLFVCLCLCLLCVFMCGVFMYSCVCVHAINIS